MDSVNTYLNRGTQQRFSVGDDAAFIRDNSAAGVNVNHYTALKYNPVWGALTRISGDIAKLPYNLLTTDPTKKEYAVDHPTYDVIRYEANEYTSAFRFWRTFMFHALLYNRAYAYIERDQAGTCIALWELPPYHVAPFQTVPGGDYDAFQIQFQDMTSRVVPAYMVFDVVGMQHDATNLLDTTQLAAENWGTGIAANAFLNQFFSSGSLASGVLEVPAETKPQSAVGMVQGLDKALKGLSNAFGTVVLRDGAKYHQLSVSPVDAQMVELLSMGVSDVARWFNLPPSELGAEGTGGYGSREQDAKRYLDSCLSPWLANIVSQSRMKLLTTADKRAYEFRYDTSALIQADVATESQVYKTYEEAGVLSPNEVRQKLGLNPREGGDEYYHSNNMQPDSEIEPVDQQADAGDDDDAEADEETPVDVSDDVERLWSTEVDRVHEQWQGKLAWQRSRRGAQFDAWWTENRNATQIRIMDDLRSCASLVALVRSCTAERVSESGLEVIWQRLMESEESK